MRIKPNGKRILFIGGNYYPEPTGIGKYNGEMVDMLARSGYECMVITTYPYYPYWQVQEPYTGQTNRYKKETRVLPDVPERPIRILRCPHYVPGKPTARRRILLDCTFFFFALLKIMQLLFAKRFDSVIAVVPSFQVGLLGVLYKRIKKARFIYHIQDLQIDAAKELKMIKSARVINLLFRVEKFILNNADVVSSISLGMINKIKHRTKKDVVYFPNWVDTDAFFPISEQSQLKMEYNLRPSDKIILYSGSIGEKQGLDNILDVAERLINEKAIKFIICGSGPYKRKLELKAKKWNLDNVVFLPLQPAEKLNQFLNMADVHLVLQKGSACDLVMPSKLATILSVGGIAIVSAPQDSNLYNFVNTNELGILVGPENPHSLSEAIKEVIYKNNERIKTNARQFALERLTVEKVLSQYVRNNL